MWIDSARFEGDIKTAGCSRFSRISSLSSISSISSYTSHTSPTRNTSYTISNAWLTKDGAVLVGGKHQTPWWNGRTTDAAMAKAKYSLTRFVSGQEGLGGTDRIDSVAKSNKVH